MSNIEAMGTTLHDAQHRIAVLSHNIEAFLAQPALLSVVMEELAVVLEEVQQQYEEVLITRQTLENQRQYYQELFDFAPDGYLVTDAQGVIQEANQSAVRLFEARQAFLVQKPLVLLVANVDRRAFRDYFSRLQTSPQQRNWELHLKTRQGRVFPAVVATSAIHTAQGTLMGWRWLVRDITALKQAHSDTNIASAQAALDDLRSNFIQVVSHELRTPMTTVLMSLELLKRYGAAQDTPKQQTYLDRMQQAIWRMNALIKDVLLYADADADPISLGSAPINLELLCAECIKEQQTRDGDRHPITISSKDCDAVYVDDALMRQIFDRLLSNAVTYSPAGAAVHVVMQCERDRTCISVQNEGTYISAEQQAKLFEPFYRLEETANIPGRGLGLAIVKQAVDRHGGELTVESSVEAGTTFSVTLPGAEQQVVDRHGGELTVESSVEADTPFSAMLPGAEL